jgi:hypothetical protein
MSYQNGNAALNDHTTEKKRDFSYLWKIVIVVFIVISSSFLAVSMSVSYSRQFEKSTARFFTRSSNQPAYSSLSTEEQVELFSEFQQKFHKSVG